MNKQELLDKKMALAKEADAILEHAKAENRAFLNGDENAKFDGLHDEIEKISGMLTRMAKQEALAEPEGRRSEPPMPERRGNQTSYGKATAQDQTLALRGWLMAGSQEVEPTEEHRSAAARVGVNLAAKSIKLRLPQHALRSLMPGDIADWEKRAAVGVASGSVGGYTVADSPMGALERALLEFGGMRQVATVIRTDSGSDMPIPTNDDTSNKGAILAENTQVSEVDPTFGQLVLQAYKYSSKSVLVSVEFLQDSSIDFNGFIGKALGERIGRIQNDHFTTGDGSSKPNGIVTAATSSSVTFAGTATVIYDDLVNLIHSVDPAYRMNARFMFHDGALKMLRKTKVLQYSGDTVGVPLWQPSMVAGTPDLLMGYPYVINQSMTTPATGVKSILFGDLSKYIIRDCREVTLLRLDERYADYHQVGFLAFARSDGDLLDAGTHPVKYGTQA